MTTGNQMRHATTTGAFTLIELLVVVSIIAVLAGLLLPAVSLVRDASKQSVCAANVRQVYIATLAYTDDSDGRLPVAAQASGGGTVYWPDLLASYLDLDLPDPPTFAMLHDAGPVAKVTTCPASGFPTPSNAYCDIGYNNYGLSTGIWATNLVRLSRVRKKDQLYLFADSIFYAASGPRGHCCLNDGTRIHFRHRNRANTMFCDGHLEPTASRTFNWLQYPIYEWPLP